MAKEGEDDRLRNAGVGVVRLLEFRPPCHPAGDLLEPLEPPSGELGRVGQPGPASAHKEARQRHALTEVLVIASALYKQHFRLADGTCMEYPEQSLRVWPARLNGDAVEIGLV